MLAGGDVSAAGRLIKWRSRAASRHADNNALLIHAGTPPLGRYSPTAPNATGDGGRHVWPRARVSPQPTPGFKAAAGLAAPRDPGVRGIYRLSAEAFFAELSLFCAQGARC